MISRATIRDAFTAAIVAAATPCATRVYPGRTRPFLARRADLTQALPAACVYVPERASKMGMAAIGRQVDKVAVEVYVLDPSPSATDPDKALEDTLDDVVDAVETAILCAPEIRALFERVPDVTTYYGVTSQPAERVGGATLVFECASARRVSPAAPTSTFKRAVIETDFIGPHGAETDDGLGPDGRIEAETRIGNDFV